MNLYPYKIRVTDPVLIKAFTQVSNSGYTKLQPNIAKRIGQKIPRKIKRDGVMVKDGIFAIYNNRIKLDFSPVGNKAMDFTFTRLF